MKYKFTAKQNQLSQASPICLMQIISAQRQTNNKGESEKEREGKRDCRAFCVK